MTTGHSLIIGVLALSLAQSAIGQRVMSELRPDRAFLGKEIRYYVQATGAKSARCKVPEVDGLKFELVDQGVTSRGTQITIINGRRTTRESSDYTFVYKVTPARAGRFVIPASEVGVNDKTLRTNRCTLTVTDPADDDRAVIEFHCEPPHVVLGQEATLIVDVLLKHIPEAQDVKDPLDLYDKGQGFFDSGTPPPTISLPWVVEPPQGLGPIDLNGWVKSRQQRARGFRFTGVRGGRFLQPNQVADAVRKDRGGAAARYRRYRFSMPIRGEVAGRYEFPSATLDGNLVARDGGRLVWREAFARSAPLSIEVLEPPAEGRPASFGGAVGHFSFEMEPPTPTIINVGDPVYVTLVAKGRGFLKGVSLDLGTQLGEEFRVERVGVTDALPAGTERPPGFPDRLGQWRQWDFKVYPVDAAVTALPGVAFSWFDPERKAYAATTTKPVPITVRKSAATNSNVVVAGRTGGSEREVELVPTEALSANVTDLNLLQDESPRPWLALTTVLALPFVYFGLAFFVGRSRRLRDDPALLRRRRAGARARDRLRAAEQAAQRADPAAITIAHEALCGYVADLSGQDEGALTSDELVAWMRRNDVGDALQQRIARLCEAVEATTYGGGTPAAEQLPELVGGLDKVISKARASVAASGSASALLLFAVMLPAVMLPMGELDAQQDPAEITARLNQAQTAFSARQFKKAAECYERVLEDGFENGYVLYNLGNTYLRTGELGRAIAAYRRASLYLPGDANLAVNLQRALEARKTPLSRPDQRSILDYLLFWRPYLPFARVVQLALATALLAFVLAVWRLFSGGSMPAVKWAAIVLVVATLLLGTSAGLSYQDLRTKLNGVVVADGVVLRNGPGETFDARFEQALEPGAELAIQSAREGWLKVLAGGQYEGWLPAVAVARW